MGYALQVALELEDTVCCVCGTRFAVDATIMHHRRQNAGDIYCPNGHCIGWKETEADKVRKQLAAKEKELEAERQRVGMERSMRYEAEAAKNKAEMAFKRQTRRINKGVCPHCQRTFQQLARHIACKHPERGEKR
jgi:hypothetical protein